MKISNITSDPIYVRASLSGLCNLNCVYCPKKEGMENRVPNTLKGNYLSVQEYCFNLKRLARSGIKGVSFTGGEPTLNPNLPEIIAYARTIFDRVELTSNGFRLLDVLPLIAHNLDLLKISLDAIDESMIKKITQSNLNEKNRVIQAIEEGYKLGLRIGINMVVMKSNVSEIDSLVNLCRKIDVNNNGNIYLSLLDFYYSNEKRNIWEKEFIPLNTITNKFTELYGEPIIQERFGCNFFWFNANGISVRFKDSFGATHRYSKCETCKQYCQEGIYGIKHSVEGWITTCPTGDEEFGFHLAPKQKEDKVDSMLSTLISEITNAKPNMGSFDKLLSTHHLKPFNI